MKLLTLFSVFAVFNTLVQSENRTKGSTLFLKAIVLGRCNYYLEFKGSNTKQSISVDCEDIWKKFNDSFAFKDPCKLVARDYEPFFEAAQGKDIFNKAMFWSGTSEAAHYYSYFDIRFTTLEDTFVGYMMNDLRWCGNRNSRNGIDYKSCPSCFKFNKIFWRQASKKFAERVRGVVHVMLNGTLTTRSAYKNTSIFAEYELPNLKVQNITLLKIIVVHAIGQKIKESCGEKSIEQLKIDAENRYPDLKIECVDDPDAVKHVLCIDRPDVEECRFAEEFPNEIELWKVLAIVFVVLSIGLLILIAVLLICCKKRQGKAKTSEDA